MKTVVVGGGIIGKSVAWQLQKSGIATTLLDPGRPNASCVAAGMLSPFVEAPFENAKWLEIGKKSFELYPAFLEELSQDSGEQIELIRSGSLLVALDQDDAHWIEQTYKASLEDIREKEPFLSPKITGGLFFAQEAQIEPKKLLKALKKAFLARGGRFFYATIDPQKIQADHLIICAGVFSKQFGAPVFPMKGEIITLKSPITLKHMVRTPRLYITPFPDGTLRLGATNHEKGLNLSLQSGSLRTLLQEAFEALPLIDEMPLISCEVGLRPTTSSHLPLIEEKNNTIFATGHGRSGFLWAPYTAQQIVRRMLCKLS
ncbi:MAG: Glycine oxidase [Chlamydiales bacterium]|nr:Glycine oxidase [Chlamydiales bacterium]